MAHWYVFRGDWLWCGYGIRPETIPKMVKGSTSRCVTPGRQSFSDTAIRVLFSSLLSTNSMMPFLTRPMKSIAPDLTSCTNHFWARRSGKVAICCYRQARDQLSSVTTSHPARGIPREAMHALRNTHRNELGTLVSHAKATNKLRLESNENKRRVQLAGGECFFKW